MLCLVMGKVMENIFFLYIFYMFGFIINKIYILLKLVENFLFSIYLILL